MDQILGSPQFPVRELELPFLLESAKVVLGTLVKERGYGNKSAKALDVMASCNVSIHC